MVGLAPVTIAERLSALRQYFKYAFLHEYVNKPIEVFLPHPPQRLPTKLPTVWNEEQIERLINSVDITTPIGKRDYAIILLGARLGNECGIDKISPHGMRRSRAMHPYRAGMPLPLLAEFLGHEDPETARIYAYDDTEMKRKAIEKASQNVGEVASLPTEKAFWEGDDDIIGRLCRGY